MVPFPFSDLSSSKRRPALVLADLPGDDIILCQITSQNVKDIHAVKLYQTDIVEGSLTKESNIRPTRIFTADKNIILKTVGKVSEEKFKEVKGKIIRLIDPPSKIQVV